MSLLFYCRPGFENEVAAEVARHYASKDLHGYAKSQPESGWLTFHGHDPEESLFDTGISYHNFVFVRQGISLFGDPVAIAGDDRVTPLVAALTEHLARLDNLPSPLTYRELIIEHPDTNEGRKLKDFCRKFRSPLASGLRKAGVDRHANSPWHLHAFFAGYQQAAIGISHRRHHRSWPLGIPRLKLPADAPSRSTLKLEEAFKEWLKPGMIEEGMTACDLGAAPGGWTYQLVKRGLYVHAVDNGPMAAPLLATGMVDHIEADAYHFSPKTPVDWLVCDMVDSPARVMALMVRWLKDGKAQRVICNLKLPMKKRGEEIDRCRQLFFDSLPNGVLDMKQLYHDRKEITFFAQATPLEG